MPTGQALPDQLHQAGIVQQPVHRVQQVVLEQRGLPHQRQVEQPRLARSSSDHSVLDYIEYDSLCQEKSLGNTEFFQICHVPANP
jgi:hypothetical protein